MDIALRLRRSRVTVAEAGSLNPFAKRLSRTPTSMPLRRNPHETRIAARRIDSALTARLTAWKIA